MDEPIVCYSCGKVMLRIYYEMYSDGINAGLKPQVALLPLHSKLPKYCCRRMILSHVPLAENQLYLRPITKTK